VVERRSLAGELQRYFRCNLQGPKIRPPGLLRKIYLALKELNPLGALRLDTESEKIMKFLLLLQWTRANVREIA